MLQLLEGVHAHSVIVYMTLLTALFGLLVVAALNVLAVVGVLLCVSLPL
jgi:hypothetical protein